MAQTIQAGNATLSDAATLTITTGDTAQALFAADEARVYLIIQNLHATSNLWIDFEGVTAVKTQPSLQIGPGITLIFESSFCPITAISIIGPTSTQAFNAKQGLLS